MQMDIFNLYTDSENMETIKLCIPKLYQVTYFLILY